MSLVDPSDCNSARYSSQFAGSVSRIQNENLLVIALQLTTNLPPELTKTFYPLTGKQSDWRFSFWPKVCLLAMELAKLPAEEVKNMLDEAIKQRPNIVHKKAGFDFSSLEINL